MTTPLSEPIEMLFTVDRNPLKYFKVALPPQRYHHMDTMQTSEHLQLLPVLLKIR